MSFPLAGQDFDSGKCASYFQELLSWHTCHHRFCGDWDWPLSQPDTQSLTWFDYKRRTFNSCIIYPFTSALQPAGLWRCKLFWQLWFRLYQIYLQKNKWIFLCISSPFSVLPFCLPPLYYFSFLLFFKFAHLMTVPQSAHLCDARWLNTCNYRMHRPDEFVSEL